MAWASARVVHRVQVPPADPLAGADGYWRLRLSGCDHPDTEAVSRGVFTNPTKLQPAVALMLFSLIRQFWFPWNGLTPRTGQQQATSGLPCPAIDHIFCVSRFKRILRPVPRHRNVSMTSNRLLLSIGHLLLFATIVAQSAARTRAEEPFEAFLRTHCLDCHAAGKVEGDLRIDQLSRDFNAGIDTHHWAEVIDKVNSGQMPPKDRPQPSIQDIADFVRTLDGSIQNIAGSINPDSRCR